MARNPKQDANLKPIKKGELSKDEAKIRGSKGGKASAEARRAKRDARQSARYILDLASRGDFTEVAKRLGAAEKDGTITNLDVLNARLFTLAMNGNLEAYKALMTQAGFDPKENRDERESLEAQQRRMMELEAKLNALGAAPPNATVAVGLGGEDSPNDVMIYLPKVEDPADLEMGEEEEEADTTEGG